MLTISVLYSFMFLGLEENIFAVLVLTVCSAPRKSRVAKDLALLLKLKTVFHRR